MDATHVYALLRQACHLLEADNEHAMAAHVGQAMEMIEMRYGTQGDHQPIDETD